MQWRERSIPGRQNDEVSGPWSDGRPRPSTQLQNRKRPSDRNTIGKRSREATPEISPARQCGETLQERSRVPFRGRHPTGEDARRSKSKKGGRKPPSKTTQK